MRGDAALQARLLLRGTGLAGTAVALGGALAMIGAYRPWHAVTVELTLLGAEQSRPVADLAGWEAHPFGWLVPALGLLTIGLGVALAVDRPPQRTRPVLLVAGVTLAVTAVVAALRPPEVGRFDVAGSRLRELSGLADRLPSDVELSFSVGHAHGLALTLAAAALVVVATLSARELR